MKIQEKIKGFRYFAFGVIAVIGIIVALLGGGIFTSFGVLFITGLVLGWQGKKFKQLYDDYRLGLRVNAIMYSSKAMEEKEREREQMVKEIGQLRERIAAYNVLKEGENQA